MSESAREHARTFYLWGVYRMGELTGELTHARRRRIIKTRGHFPSDEADTKLIWIALRNITADWSRASRGWKAAMNQFAITYDDRFMLAR